MNVPDTIVIERKPAGDRSYLPLALVLVALAYPIYVWGLGDYPIRDAESKYAEIPREILESGDWLTLHLDYTRYLSKPPLSFWITAAGYFLGDVNEFWARLPNVLAALVLALLLGAIGEHFLGRRGGILVACLWLTTGEVYLYTRDAGIEMTLLVFLAATVLCFLRGPLAGRPDWTLAMWGMAGLALLTKGPILLLTVASLALWCILTGRRVRWDDLRIGPGLLLVAATVGPWLGFMIATHPDFLWYAVVHEVIYRLLGKRLPNDALYPTGLFLAQVAGEFFPWCFALPHALARAARTLGRGSPGRDVALFGLLWAGVPLLVFALARSKVDFYGLHAYPGFILLVAWLWEQAIRSGGAREALDPRALAMPWVACAAGATAAAALLLLAPGLAAGFDLPGPYVLWSFLGPAWVGSVLAAWACLRGHFRTALGGASLLALGFFAANGQIFAGQEAEVSLRFAAVAFRNEAPAEARLVATERPEFAHVAILPFYAHRQAWLLRHPEPSQLHFTLKDPEQVVLDEAELVRWVEAGKVTYLVGDREQVLPRLKRLGLVGEERAQGGDRVLVRLRKK